MSDELGALEPESPNEILHWPAENVNFFFCILYVNVKGDNLNRGCLRHHHNN